MTAKKFPVANRFYLPGINGMVDLTTGNLQLIMIDYVQKDVGQDFTLRRCYDSLRVRTQQPLGERWLLNFGGRLLRSGSKLRILRENFHRDKFRSEDGRWQNERAVSLAPQLQELRSGWLLRDSLQHAQYEYDLQGRLLRVTRHGGQILTFHYDGDTMDVHGLASGQKILLGYQANKLHTVRDALGRTLIYDYEGGLLQRVTYPNHGHVDYQYDADGLLLSCRNRNGSLVLQNTYDSEKRLIRLQAEGQPAWCYTYRDQDRQTEAGPEQGGRCRYVWNRCRQIEKIVYADGTEEHYRYDRSGRCIQEQDRQGRESRRSFAASGLLLSEELPDGLQQNFDYDEAGNLTAVRDSLGREVRQEWSPRGLLLARHTRLGEHSWCRETWVYDELGRRVSYDCNGRHTRWLYTESAPVPSLLERPDGSRFGFRYDKVWRRLVIASEFGERSFGYNPLDLVVSDTDACGNILSRQYDLDGRLKPAADDVDGADGDDDDAQPESGPEEDPSHSGEREDRLHRRYNLAGQLLEQRRCYQIVDGKPRYALSRFAYDTDGNCIQERYWLEGQDEQSASGRVLNIQRSYDQAGRLQYIVDSLGAAADYSYNSLNQCTRERFLLEPGVIYLLRYIYDAAGRLTGTALKLDYPSKKQFWREQAAVPGEEDGAAEWLTCLASGEQSPCEVLARNEAGWAVRLRADGQEWHYDYDARGHVIRFEDAAARTGWYRLDTWGRIEEAHGLTGEVLFFAYDAAGNIRLCMNRQRAQFIYDFDETNALTDGGGEGLDILGLADHRHERPGSRWQQLQIRSWAGQPVSGGPEQPLDLYTYLCMGRPRYADPVGYIRRKEMGRDV